MYRSPGESCLYLIELLNRTPALSYETTLSHIEIEHVHGVVDGLDLLNLWTGERVKGEGLKGREREGGERGIGREGDGEREGGGKREGEG